MLGVGIPFGMLFMLLSVHYCYSVHMSCIVRYCERYKFTCESVIGCGSLIFKDELQDNNFYGLVSTVPAPFHDPISNSFELFIFGNR